jgi:putative ABC transport system permease protein
MLWVMDEINYDLFHTNADNIYRITTEIEIRDQVAHNARTPARIGPYLKETYPEVVNYARFYHNSGNDGSWRVRYEDKSFTEYNSGFAEPEFFEVFTFPLIAGDPKTALADPYSIVLTESTAKKYFGDEDPLGKTLVLDDQFNFIVNGIMKDVPANSHMQFDFLVSVYFWEELNIDLQTWVNFRFYTYIQLDEKVDYVSFAENITGVINEHNDFFTSYAHLQPFNDIHLFSSYEQDLAGHGDVTYVYLFSAIALFILLIACFNFINLSTARANKRAKEVGLRKVVGAFKSNLILQFLGESIVLSFLALFFALILTDLLLPYYNELSGKTLYISNSLELIISIIGIALFTGFVSGSYPAFFLSSFQPSRTLKGSISQGKRNSIVREFTVIVQFTLSIILIIATLLVYRQLNYISEMKLGFTKEHVLYLNFSGQVPIMQRYESIKNELLGTRGVVAVEKVSQIPPNITAGIDSVSIIGSGSEDAIFMNLVSGGYDLKKTFDFEIKEGRYFSREFGADTNGVVINETAAARFGDPDPIGKQIRFFNTTRTIIGIVKDFHLQSIREEISPTAIVTNPDFANYLVLRIQSHNITSTLDNLNNTLSNILPDYSQGFRFLDDDFDALYRAEMRLGKLTNYSTILAIIISCMGLLGLASHSAQQRTKEIGIRKTLGASNSGIVVLFSKEFTKWVIIANVIAWPVSYYLMNRWLENFVYKIDISYWVFILAGVISLLIAMITVSSQAIKASLANPVESLRDE